MQYKNIHKGIFRERSNRFIALVDIDGITEVCHVKNTGRCKELLIPGVSVYLEKSDNPARKTAYDLIGVDKLPDTENPQKTVYVNMDSQAPNLVAREWLEKQGWEMIRPESRFGESRLDFYLEMGQRKAFLEVKGVTLEENGVARFPDAPTERGIKHIKELIRAKEQGYEAYILFVIQMKGISRFEPNDRTHPEFGQTLRKAANAGVEILAYDCITKPGRVEIDQPVSVRL